MTTYILYIIPRGRDTTTVPFRTVLYCTASVDTRRSVTLASSELVSSLYECLGAGLLYYVMLLSLFVLFYLLYEDID